MKPAQILRQKIASGSLTLGVIATHHVWLGLVEVVMRAGLDYLIVDLEHLTHGHEKVVDLCTLGRMTDFPVLVRPPAVELTHVRLAMDLGPCGMLLPYVESATDMAVAQDALLLKPRGRRRPGGPGNRWVEDFNYETWKKEVEADFVVLPQIESRVGLENAEAIARHPLTTAMAIGPYDLSADLGVCWKPGDPSLVGAWGRIRDAAKAAGKPMWAIGDPAQLMRQGFTFLCIGEPISTLEQALTETASRLRSAAGAPQRAV